MRLVTYVEDIRQLGLAKEADVTEVIIGAKLFSRFGKLEIEEANRLAKEALDLGIRPVLEWDALKTEDQIEKLKDSISQFDFKAFKAIRTQDAGALELALSETSLPIQANLEAGNHNLEGLQSYKEYLGERLDRLVLSIELPLAKLKEYRESLNCPIEFLALGRILLFYTPRNLLSSMLPEDDEQRAKPQLSAVGESEESPHKGFPVVENAHGTFMFHIKRQFLLEHLEEMEFIDFLRVDLRFDEDFGRILKIADVLNKKLDPKEFKNAYPYDVIKGFYKVNKTDVLFKKLKNRRIQRKDENYIGEILEICKGSHQVLRLKGKAGVEKGMRLKFITPEGKELEAPLVELKNVEGKDIEFAAPESIVLMNYLGGVWVKSQVYLAEN